MRNNKGFSLVELIVVIAIMAILAAVAVVGVSVYIPKAQQANDEQMIADIQKAINLYATAEELAPGQSGYVVVHKNGGGNKGGNVSVGGTAEMSELIADALEGMYGASYVNELKVTYKGWTGSYDMGSSVEDIVGSSYYENTDALLGKVQSLTNALAGFYGDDENAQIKANQATLDIANNAAQYVNADKFVTWWTTTSFGAEVSSDVLSDIPTDVDSEARLKFSLAAMYARAEAFVSYTGCNGCRVAFDEASQGFNSVADANEAILTIGTIMGEVAAHIDGNAESGACTQCSNCMDTYFTARGATDAKAYLALMGQVDSMSETIKNSEEFASDSLYTSDFVTNAVGGYVSAADAFKNCGAQDGDIVIIALVDSNGEITYKIYPIDY